MALIIGVSVNDTFYIDDTPVHILETEGYTKVKLEVQGINKQFTITDKQTQEVLPSVFISTGLPMNKVTGGVPRLVIEAPRHIKILRESLYRA